ncbi:hypothetical protein [Cryptosporangium arvum]|uniref:Uncharacterized protein n=1 Tax=Cryptosporangium arvum DSM 44712 TaxID=927661 RepID=A0A010ZKX2_9ACTN|nr:hypothetical protein [Cryptosporangium arvum]EXG79269.1 hypothetical protein CryarDRAFT_0300 [Cryptosporangium arvum DSM 44712]
MTDGSTFLRPKQAARAAIQLASIADDLKAKLDASVARIKAIQAKGTQVWGDDEPGTQFVKNYNKGGDGAASATLDAATRYADVFTDVGPIVTRAIDGTVDVDMAVGEAISKLTGQLGNPPSDT